VIISRIGGTDGKPAKLPALPIEFGSDRDRPGIRMQSPRMGEHTIEVLTEAGFSAPDLNRLIESGVIASAAN
jgi:crotonobetainyl-CoA:carnitine CoA-transferase CaiB-like acyl-CoA transferase